MSSLYFQTIDASIHVRTTQPTNKDNQRPLLVFIHYWGGSSSTWHKLTTPNTPTSLTSEYPTLAIDLRGWGKSASPGAGDEGSCSINNMASDVSSILSQITTKPNHHQLLQHGFVLVGHSMGAKVAMTSLVHLSKNLMDILKGFVLVAPAPPAALDLPAEMKAQQQLAYESEESIRWTIANVLANAENLTDYDTSLIVQNSLGGTSSAKKAWPSYGMQEDVSQQVAQVLDKCSGLRARVLVGEGDFVEPKERVESEVVHFLEKHGVEVTLKTVAAVKHLIPLENPASICEEVYQL
ncbi:hypothetical protein N7450_010012 [Penicillium hetheringtonii]|uniref:AB hydrolase-1 domain-containing protein n=1 Tax=Penicillium hetheringtonii TaxID=911720 RepID=A0AAD6DBZ7_9EURO|nr:hypothetical protein N7450_010012 [Penicillium hetheringtonii]